MAGPLTHYRALIDEGALSADPAQAAAAARLQDLSDALARWRPGVFHLFAKPEAPRGVYLWGGVGRGKSLLMDLFFDTAPVEKKRRVHFHQFMQEIHARIGEWRALSEAQRRKRPEHVRSAGDDPIRPVARRTAQEARLLCFDEFQVNDIADATILGRLFEALFEEDVIVVATSNRRPDDLYAGGLNRQLFLPFIAMLNDRLDVLLLDAARDYRLERLTGAPTYYSPLGPNADAAMDRAWRGMTYGRAEHAQPLYVQGRTVIAPRVACNCARFTFDQLCARPLGAADYLAITACFQTLFIDWIPAMDPEKRNEAKRFTTLIDALYEAKAKLVCSAQARPEQLYPAGDNAFAFQRTASRLVEMQSEGYLSLAHVGGRTAKAAE